MNGCPRIIIFLAPLFLWLTSNCQTRKVDSLLKNIYSAAADNAKLTAIFQLSEEYQSIHRDSLDKYALLAKELAIKSADKDKQAWAGWMMSTSYLRWGWTDSALAAISPFLAAVTPREEGKRKLFFKLARMKAMCYGSKSNYKDALSVLYNVVREAERFKDSLVLGMNLNTIASISIAREEYNEALQTLSYALSVSPEKEKFYSNLAAIYTNMAQANFYLAQKETALQHVQKALKLSKQVENLNTLATALRVHSHICIDLNKISIAEASLKEMIVTRNKTNDGTGVIDDNLMLVNFYLQTVQAEKGIEVCKQGLKQGNLYAGEGETYNNNIKMRLPYYEALAKCYKSLGSDKLYQQTLEQIISAKDSFYHQNSAQAIAELQVQYDVQKKENRIIQQEFALTKKNYLFASAVILSLLVVIIGWLLFRNSQRKQKLKLFLMQQEERRLAAQAVKTAEEAERRRIAADLHDSLGAYAASIVSTVDLIKLDQAQTQKKAIEELGNNAHSIVAQLSDTIWVLKKDVLPLTAVSDRLKSFVQRIDHAYPHYTIDIIENISVDHKLSPSHSFHLFQIIKEAVNNALRHSSGSAVSVIIEGADTWRISIVDNGKGMKGSNNFSEGGNGLINMQQRAQECGWDIEWIPNHPSGTCVCIQSNEAKLVIENVETDL